MSDDVLDPYHKWLGIKDKQRPPNFYRLLGLEVFEDDVDVIGAAADQRIAHVRTYQLGPHSGLSQRLLNELAVARLCLLDPSKKVAYDDRLRGELRRSLEPATETVTACDAVAVDLAANDAFNRAEAPRMDSTLKDQSIAVPRAARTRGKLFRTNADTVRRRATSWSIAGGLAIGVIALVIIVTQLNPRRGTDSDADKANSKQAFPETALQPSSSMTSRDKPEDTTTSELVSPSEHLQRPPTLARAATTGNIAPEPNSNVSTADLFRPVGPTKRWSNLASELPVRLRESWSAHSPGNNQAASQLTLCHEIAQLAYANLAIAALHCPPTKDIDDEISRALSKIDEFQVFAGPRFTELFSNVPANPAIAQADKVRPGTRRETPSSPGSAKSWQDVDRCFAGFASAASRLSAILRNVPAERKMTETVNQQVEKAEQLFRSAIAYISVQLGQLPTAEVSSNRLRSVESAAMIDAKTAQTGVQQICHWTLRLCEALCVYCEYARPESVSRVEQIGRQTSQEDFASGLEQLHALLLLELELWSLINESPPSNS